MKYRHCFNLFRSCLPMSHLLNSYKIKPVMVIIVVVVVVVVFTDSMRELRIRRYFGYSGVGGGILRFSPSKGDTFTDGMNFCVTPNFTTWVQKCGKLHLPWHNFTKPGTRLGRRLNLDLTPREWSKPINTELRRPHLSPRFMLCKTPR